MGEKNINKHCEGASKSEYENTELFEDFFEGLIEGFGGKVDKITIQCPNSANYIFISLLSLIILLL